METKDQEAVNLDSDTALDETLADPASLTDAQFAADSQGFVPEIPRPRTNIPDVMRKPEVRPHNVGQDGKSLVVGRDIVLSGQIKSCESLTVEGEVESTLEDVRQLEVAGNGTFRGEATVDEATIAGLYEGSLSVRRVLTIKSSGRVKADIHAGILIVERGGTIEGSVAPFEEEADAGEGTAKGSRRTITPTSIS